MALLSRTLKCFYRSTPVTTSISRAEVIRLYSWNRWRLGQESEVLENQLSEDNHLVSQEVNDPASRDPRTGEPRLWSNWDYSTELSALAQRIGHSVESLPSLQTALTDRPLLTKVLAKERPQEYSRLSVLGRSALELYVNESLYFTFPQLEGSMLRDLRHHLTSHQTLSELAGYLGITELIKTERVLNNTSNNRFVADILCSVVGALYECQGPGAARTFVHNFVVSQLNGKNIEELIKLQHPRFMLQSILKAQRMPRAEARILRESGRATHFPTFQVGVYSGGHLLGEGHGSSVKRAEREAILAALVTQFKTQLTNTPLPSDTDPGYQYEGKIKFARLLEQEE